MFLAAGDDARGEEGLDRGASCCWSMADSGGLGLALSGMLEEARSCEVKEGDRARGSLLKAALGVEGHACEVAVLEEVLLPLRLRTGAVASALSTSP